MTPLLGEWLILLLSGTLAGLFRPWQFLRRAELQHPWLACLVVLPWLWSATSHMPSGLGLPLSGACLMVLMFGWPLAVWTLLAIGLLSIGWAHLGLDWFTPTAQSGVDAAAAALAGESLSPLQLSIHSVVWSGIVPASIAVVLGALIKRWLPHHLFVYILARGFLATAVALVLAAALELSWVSTQPTLGGSDLLLARWLMASGEAVATGMLTAIFVAFAPRRLLTYSDDYYLPQ